MRHHELRLLAVHEILERDSRTYFHLAVGYHRGSPWRFDSVYLLNKAFELVEPPFRALPRFVPHGVSVVAPGQMPHLERSLLSFAERLDQANRPHDLYGDRAVYKPALEDFPTFGAAKPVIGELLAELREWVGAQAREGHGITVYAPGR